jgi:hypothetical protein
MNEPMSFVVSSVETAAEEDLNGLPSVLVFNDGRRLALE